MIAADNKKNLEKIVADGRTYSVNGWNGEEWTDCREIADGYGAIEEQKYCITPEGNYDHYTIVNHTVGA